VSVQLSDVRTAADKAAALVEALPWLEQFQGATIVVKYGGHAMTDEALRAAFAQDVVFLRRVGINVVVVHGGGPQIDSMLSRLDIPSEFRSGLRVTTPEAMDVVRMVLVGQVQRQIVGLINDHGPLAVGMSGEDAHLFTARRIKADANGAAVDLGQVGEVAEVRPTFVRRVLDDALVPVVSSIARGADGATYNVNADTAAAQLAIALDAQKLVMLTDVHGLLRNFPDPTTLISEVSVSELSALLPTLEAGMLPKMAACVAAVEAGVGKAHVLDGRLPHALLLEVFTDEGVGTQVVPDALAGGRS
jgi:acetylglutamate kinase